MIPVKRIFLTTVAPPGGFSYSIPPLGLLYIAAYLRERFSLDIRVADQRAEGWSAERLAKEIISFDPHIIGLSCMTPSSYALPEVTGALRAALPGAIIVLGGPHVNASRTAALSLTDADVAVSGEGEIAMEQIVRARIEGSGMENIPGLIRRDRDGSVIINSGVMPFVSDPDSLPMPAYDLIDIRKYWSQPSTVPIHGRKYISLFSSRGCPYRCMYCHNVFGKRFRAHSAERIISEIKYLTEKFGVNEIEFLDDCFNLDKKRVIAYSELLLREIGPVKTGFPNALRADLIDEETADALVSAGMYFTCLALESGTPRIQELIGKKLDIQKFLKAAELCDKRRVFTNGFAMLGFPTETASEIEQTIRTASESKLHIASFFRVTPFPGTPLYEYVVQNSPEKLNEISFNDMECRTLKANLSQVDDKTLDKYTARAYREFYLRPERLYRILRNHPSPMKLPAHGLIFLKRMLGEFF